MKLVFVYGFEPSGHSSAAQALELAARSRGLRTERINIAADYHPILGPAIAKAYLALVSSFPGLWSVLHDSTAVAEAASNWRKLYRTLGGGKLRATLAELRADRIVCTHAAPFGALALENEEEGLGCPLVAVMTDFAPHPYWIEGGDLYLTPSPAASQALVARGIAGESVRDTGIPISPAFAAALPRAQARRELGLPAGGPLILVSGGGRGLGRLPELVASLLGKTKARIAAVCGQNAGAYEELRARFGARARVWGQADQATMRRLMAASDLLVGKAGGLTIAEALACGLPLLFFEPIAGQEESNARVLEEAGAARRAGRLEQVPRLAEKMLRPAALEALRRRAAALGRPDAAGRAIETIVSLQPRGPSLPRSR